MKWHADEQEIILLDPSNSPIQWSPTRDQWLNLQLWVKDLRSGKYIQGKRRLKALNNQTNLINHCCLGVICEEAGFQCTLRPDQQTYEFETADGRWETGMLSGAYLRDRYGLPVDLTHLAGANDEGNKSFEDIATYLQLWLDSVKEPLA